MDGNRTLGAPLLQSSPGEVSLVSEPRPRAVRIGGATLKGCASSFLLSSPLLSPKGLPLWQKSRSSPYSSSGGPASAQPQCSLQHQAGSTRRAAELQRQKPTSAASTGLHRGAVSRRFQQGGGVQQSQGGGCAGWRSQMPETWWAGLGETTPDSTLGLCFLSLVPSKHIQNPRLSHTSTVPTLAQNPVTTSPWTVVAFSLVPGFLACALHSVSPQKSQKPWQKHVRYCCCPAQNPALLSTSGK